MKKVTIDFEGGATWVMVTDDEEYIQSLHASLINPKSKNEFVTVNDKVNNKQITFRKSKVIILSVEDFKG